METRKNFSQFSSQLVALLIASAMALASLPAIAQGVVCLTVDKTCRVEPAPTVVDDCKGKLQQFDVIWYGDGDIDNVAVVNGSETSTMGPLSMGDELTVFGPFSDNNVIVTFDGGMNGQSVFHMSCSDDDFDSSDDCGKDAGDGKGENGFDNTWLLEGFIDAEGRVLDCNPPSDGVFSDKCSFEASPQPSCDSLDDAGEDLSSLTILYTGGGCPGMNNQPDDKVSCTGEIVDISIPVDVTLENDKLSASPSILLPGDTFILSGDFSSNTELALVNSSGTEALEFHTSCSKPLAVGDSFGSLEIVGMNGQDGGANVTYQYKVTNNSDLLTLTNIVLEDDLLGPICPPQDDLPGPICPLFSLEPGATETLSVTARITGDMVDTVTNSVTNTVTAMGILPDGSECMDDDTVTVTVVEPTCVVIAEFYKLEDDKIKFKLTNTGVIVATLEALDITFPGEYGFIKEVKLDGAIYKRDDSLIDIGPGIEIGPTDWTKPDISKRQLEPGETRKLEIVFTEKFKDGKDGTGWGDLGVLTFGEGCSVQFPMVPDSDEDSDDTIPET